MVERVSKDIKKLSFKTLPTVFMFRPTEYVLVPSDKLQRWEEDLKTEIGVMRVDKASIRNGSWSLCGSGDWNWDDCDEV